MQQIKLILLFLALNYFQHAISVQTCDDYITNDWPDNRYIASTISGDHVVTDSMTGLMWKQCSEGLSAADCLTGDGLILNWQQALELPQSINTSIGFAGFNDWRLPNKKELMTLATRHCTRPSINETIFPNTFMDKYWSSTPISSNASWFVKFDFGSDNITGRTTNSFIYIRLVRSVGL